ncbi:MAG: hypothetical protein AB1401_00440 [Thermodesulfobacteriota bacterium]
MLRIYYYRMLDMRSLFRGFKAIARFVREKKVKDVMLGPGDSEMLIDHGIWIEGEEKVVSWLLKEIEQIFDRMKIVWVRGQWKEGATTNE